MTEPEIVKLGSDYGIFIEKGEAVVRIDHETDFAALEERIMALYAHEGVKVIRFEIARHIEAPGVFHFAFPPKAKSAKPPPDYLQHDPTKRHRRTRR